MSACLCFVGFCEVHHRHLFVCIETLARVDLCRLRRRAPPKFRDASLISCGSGCTLHFFWTVFQLDVPVARLMGLPKVDASCVGCQKVKVPYLF